MRLVAFAALLLPEIVLAQTARTDCYSYTPQSVNCTTRVAPSIPPPQINPRSFSDAFARGRQDALREEMIQQQAQLAEAERRNLELQNQLLQQQVDEQNARRRAEQLARWKAEDEAREARRLELERRSAELMRKIEENSKPSAEPKADEPKS